MTFAILFSLSFLIKYLWWSPVPLRVESYNFQHSKNNCRRLVFWVFLEHLFYHINFGRLHCYEVTLVKKYNKTQLQKVKQRFSTEKDFIEYLFKVNEKKNLGVLRLNQVMSKVLTLSKYSQLNC